MDVIRKQDQGPFRLLASPEEGQVDGRGGDEADRREEEGQRRLQVLAAVRDFMASRNRRGKRRHAR